MDIKQQILHYYRVEDRSLRDISRLTNTDRKTPKYKPRKYTARVVLDVIQKEIDKWLKENERQLLQCLQVCSQEASGEGCEAEGGVPPHPSLARSGMPVRLGRVKTLHFPYSKGRRTGRNIIMYGRLFGLLHDGPTSAHPNPGGKVGEDSAES